MASSLQIAGPVVGSILLLTSLTVGVVLGAPGQPQQPQQPATALAGGHQKPRPAQSASPQASAGDAAAAAATATGGQANNGVRHLSPVATELSNMPSLVSLRDAPSAAPAKPAAAGADDDMEAFDGRNPFTDDSLWQIPVHFAQELSSAARSGDNMAKSASELTAAADENADERLEGDSAGIASILDHQLLQRPSGAASAPAVIAASTADLKTAAGYHHATPHHYGHGQGHSYGPGYGHHGAGHYGGHHDGHHDHYGKYFQYASVPYPYAWDFGYRRGNPYHTIERYEHGKGPHFQTKVKWSDKHGGYGVHVWDYNHDDHSKHHYDSGHYSGGHHAGPHGYEAHGPAHYGHHAGHPAHYGHH